MRYFTADTHFCHSNIIKYCNRPFKNITEMNEVLIKNWNSVVQPNDEIYHLGDFGLGPIEVLKEILDRLNGKKYICIGSHDKQIWELKNKFIKVGQILETENIILCHYAMRVWPRSHYDSWHLYGHSHGNLPEFYTENCYNIASGKSFDVGVDSHNFMPWSLKEIEKKMEFLPDNFNLIKKEK